MTALFVLWLLLLAATSSAKADVPINGQTTVTTVDPYGQGIGTFTVFYGLPQTVQVGTNLTVPVKMSVNSLTGLMNFLSSYNVTILLDLSNGKHLSGTVGVSGTQAAENLGALQLRAGQAWGPVNITMPFTATNTGLSQGHEVLANVTVQVFAQIYLNQPVNFFRPEQNQTSVGYLVVQDGTPAGPQPNYPGVALLGLGVILVVTAVAMRQKKPSSVEAEKKAPGAV